MAIWILPTFLRLAHRPGERYRQWESARGAILHARTLKTWAVPVTATALLVTLIVASGLREPRVNNNLLDILPEDHLASIDTRTIAGTLGGTQTVEILLPPGDKSIHVLSMASLVRDVTELEGIVCPAAMPRVSPGGYGLVSFLMVPAGSKEQAAVFEAVQEVAHKSGWMKAEVTGLSVQIAKDSNALVKGQLEGLFATICALWLVMAIGFRSWKMGLLGLIPNTLPLILINGTLAQMERPLSVASSMIGTVMLGLVVDDTIHLLHAYREAPGNTVQRVTRAFREVRRAIVITTMVLVVGFSATLLGKLPPTREFGILAVATLLIALVADLFILPAFLLLGRSSVKQPRARQLES
jgi:predicted RND superfamily exporter protein